MFHHRRASAASTSWVAAAARIALGLAALAGTAPIVLAQEQAPRVQPAPRLPLKLFAQLERTESAEISPDGKHFVSISNKDGRYCVTIHPLPVGSGKVILYPPYDPHFEYLWAHWASDSRVLASEIAAFQRGDTGRYVWSATNETRLLSMAADGSSVINAVRPVKEAALGSHIARATGDVTAPIQDNVIDWLPSEADHVLVSINDHPTPGGGASVRKIDVTNGEYSYLKGPAEGVFRYQTDRAGQVRIGYGQSNRGSTVVRWVTYRDPATDQWRDIPDSALVGDRYRLVDFDSDPRFAFVLGPGTGDRRALLRWDVAADRSIETVYSDPDSEVEGVVFAPGHSRQIIGVQLQHKTEYLDPIWKARMAALHQALPQVGLDVTSATRDGKQFVVHAFSATEPGVYYLFNADKQQLTAIDYARAGLEPEQLAPVRLIQYRARDGLTIQGLLTVPRGVEAKSLPAVLLPHGGPLWHDSLTFDWLAQFLANRGYAVLQPNFRGSSGYGIAFEHAGDRQWGRAMQDDLTDGAQWLVEQGIADRSRMAIVGASYGGYAALMGAVRTPDLFRCAVSLNGVSDLVALLTSDSGGFKDEDAARRIGDPGADREMLEAVSPIRQVDKIKVPVLLVHAKDDLRVDFDQSQRMYRALKRADKVAELVPVEKGEHWLLNEAGRTQFLTALERFLAANLPPPAGH